MSRRLAYVGVALSCVVVLAVLCGGIWAYSRSSFSRTPAPATVKSPQSEQAKPVMVVIGAQHIVARQENYDHDDSLWRLVNKTHPLTNASYTPAALTKAPISVRTGLRDDEQSLRTVLVPELQSLVKAAAVEGITLTLGSGYRSPELQQYFFDNYAARDGKEAANKYSALPGQSEHQTGLALDFASGDMACYLEQCFADTPAGKWLATHAYEYGFILRYTKDAEATTGYQFEPWHYRYVGKELATALHREHDMVLEDAWPALIKARDELLGRKEITR